MAKLGRKPKVVPDDVLELFEQRDDRAEPLTASEIADEFGCARKTAYNKLRALEDDDRLTSKKVGGRSRVYWVPIRDKVDTSSADRDDGPGGESFDPPESDLDDARDTPPREADHAELEDALTDVDFPDGQDRDDCIAAVLAARDYLQSEGPASMREIVAEIMPEHSLGYDLPEIEPGERYRGAWWRSIVQPGLRALEDVEYRDNHKDYRYIGDD